jgi:sulfoxide reductase heme-binding subunit YedZ
VLLAPLAITSTKAWIKRLGKRWKRLHQVFYAIALLVVVHYWWSQKAAINQGLTLYLPLVLLMLAARIPPIRRWFAQLRTSRRTAGAAAPARPTALKRDQR